MPHSSFKIALVGCGPNGTYALERLCVLAKKTGQPMTIDVFEKTGDFGAGWVHSPHQPASSMLNRIVGQITFASDESNIAANGDLLPASLRPDFHTWCKDRFEQTGEVMFDLGPQDWPQRYIHGLALVDQCQRYVNYLNDLPGVEVNLHRAEVFDVKPEGDRFVVHAHTHDGELITSNADNILFVTGHSQNRPLPNSLPEKLDKHAEKSSFDRVSFPYPLEQRVPSANTGPGSTVGCAGLGLTAIDVILHLTEGRGGQFVTYPETGEVIYEPGGREPEKIVGYSPSGVFTAARPFNAKEVDLAKYEHRGVFLTNETIDRLRKTLGAPVQIPNYGEQRQLDFERHVLPVLLLEMRALYYKTLFGEKFGGSLISAVQSSFNAFVSTPQIAHEGRDEAIEMLAQPVETLVRTAMRAVADLLRGLDATKSALQADVFDPIDACVGFVATVYGSHRADKARQLLTERNFAKLAATVRQWRPQFGHSPDPLRHAFDWDAMIAPIAKHNITDHNDYTTRIIAYMERDHEDARQGNLNNPTKAACDGVWRDLRQIIAYCVDYAGLLPGSHAIFVRKYMRYHNRVANGAALEVMEKMLALIRTGILDVSIGPGVEIEIDSANDAVRLYGCHTGKCHNIDILIDARLHDLDIRRDATTLYANLLKRGLIRPWQNPGSLRTAGFTPGGIDLTETFNPVTSDGHIEKRMTFLGPSSEGFVFFQVGAARPNQNHHVLNDIIGWEKRLYDAIAEHEGVMGRKRAMVEQVSHA